LDEAWLKREVFPRFSRVLARAEIYLANHSLGRPPDRAADDVSAALDAWYRDMDGAWDSIWALFVDMVCVGLLLWIATGIYMWWHLPATRGWGWLALGSGAICFAIIVATL